MTFGPFLGESRDDPASNTPETIESRLLAFQGMSPELTIAVNSVVESVNTLRPPNKRTNVTNPKSRGGVLREIEAAISSLDRRQKQAAIETPEGPQRIRGLAGSGKTVVLALKAAYLHVQHPEWLIGVTFHTRSLYQQFKDLIRRFTYDAKEDEPDWTKLIVLHSWGGSNTLGLYSLLANTWGAVVRNFDYAKTNFGRDHAFQGICRELLEHVGASPPSPLFDALLIDEGQDFPPEFFRLAYMAVSEPKRIVWAYDELQNLSRFDMLPPSELFGREISLDTEESAPKRDLILQVCYRNTQWALTCAHALGFGCYRSELVQMFDDPGLWGDIGYEAVTGQLAPGEPVVLRRKPQCSPAFFEKYVEPSEGVQFVVFGSREEEAQWVAAQILENISADELEPTDVLVVYPNPISVRKDSKDLREYLAAQGIASHIAGVTSSVDVLYRQASIAITGIYRAKGNEAPMVYVMDADWVHGGWDLIRKRNSIFTAMTRSRAWLRVCGVGKEMEMLKREYDEVVSQGYRLKFQIPTTEERERLRVIHRDLTPEEKKQRRRAQDSAIKLAEMLAAGEIQLDEIPEQLTQQLARALKDKERQ